MEGLREGLRVEIVDFCFLLSLPSLLSLIILPDSLVGKNLLNITMFSAPELIALTVFNFIKQMYDNEDWIEQALDQIDLLLTPVHQFHNAFDDFADLFNYSYKIIELQIRDPNFEHPTLTLEEEISETAVFLYQVLTRKMEFNPNSYPDPVTFPFQPSFFLEFECCAWHYAVAA